MTDRKQRFQVGDIVRIGGPRDLIITEVWHNVETGNIAYTCRQILDPEILPDSKLIKPEFDKPEVANVQIQDN